MNIQVPLQQAASLHPHHRPPPHQPARGVGVAACSDETTAGRALGRLSVLGGAAGWVRPRFPRLIRQPVNTQQGEGGRGQATRWQEKGETGAQA